jgi:hypothetical protein
MNTWLRLLDLRSGTMRGGGNNQQDALGVLGEKPARCRWAGGDVGT